MISKCAIASLLLLLSFASNAAARVEKLPPAFADLRIGAASHAFDHLGNIGEQAEAAAANGANIIYAGGVGSLGYEGLPPEIQFKSAKSNATAYITAARKRGIKSAIGYVCATSIVGLKTFDAHWPPELRSQLHTAPASWLQQDKSGNPLPSWYGGEYQPACMNNPDWRAYEKFMVRQQLETGCDGIFFDNPTVHPKGCYCPACMENFGAMLVSERLLTPGEISGATNRIEFLRGQAAAHNDAFLRFRCQIAADFLRDIRAYARGLKRGALITANNSLNSPEVLYAQCRSYAYNIYEMSKAEDFVVVEDERSMPRALANGQLREYAPTYKQLNAISHHKPVVAVTLAEMDYHTPPNLVRLAMAEAAANQASYLGWPTWPEDQRARMIQALRPEADFLRANARLLNSAQPRADLLLFLPFRNWRKTGNCKPSQIAAELSRNNIQYRVICEDDLAQPGRNSTLFQNGKLLLAGSPADFIPSELAALATCTNSGGKFIATDSGDWLKQTKAAIPEPSLTLSGPASVRALLSDTKDKTLVQLLNLNIQRLSSFQDKVTPAFDLTLKVRLPRSTLRKARFLSADPETPNSLLDITFVKQEKPQSAEIRIPKLQVAAVVVFE